MTESADSTRGQEQDVARALFNLERILYSIPRDGTEVSLRFLDGRIYIADPEWRPLPLDYGTHIDGAET
jgi:hypothetical protein